jgi:hypothetical protein
MATTINAATTGLIETSDGTAVLDLQTGGTTAIRVNATQAIGVGSSPSFGTAGQFLTSQGSAASPTWTSGGSGTVTSVSWTGGIVSIATATTTPAFTIAGTSGGIPYFSSASTWASSAALTANGVVYGGGAGGAPVSTAAGTTGQFLGANTGAAPTWQTPAGGSPGGANTQVQYNSSGSFAGSSNMVFDGSTLSVGAPSVNLRALILGTSTSGNPGTYMVLNGGVTNYNWVIGANNIVGGELGFSQTAATGGTTQGTSASVAMMLDQNKFLLVGYTASNGAYKLQVNSQIFATNAVIATSDERYKKDVTPVVNGLALVNKLNPVSFNWKPHQVHDFDLANTDVGFIAQEVQTALADSPYLSNIVKSNETTLPDETKEEFLGIADGKLIPILVKAIQELSEKLDAANEALTARIAALEAK